MKIEEGCIKWQVPLYVREEIEEDGEKRQEFIKFSNSVSMWKNRELGLWREYLVVSESLEKAKVVNIHFMLRYVLFDLVVSRVDLQEYCKENMEMMDKCVRIS